MGDWTAPALLRRRSWTGIDFEATPEPWVAVTRGWGRHSRIKIQSWSQLGARERRRIAAGLRCAVALPDGAGLAVGLDPPPLPRAKRQRVLPGLLDLKLPFALERCAYAIVECGRQPVGLVVREEDLGRFLGALSDRGSDAERVVPLGWVLWRQALREGLVPGQADASWAVVWGEGTRVVIVSGCGLRLGAVSVLRADDADGLRRTLSLVRGPAGGRTRCLCVGSRADALRARLEDLGGPDGPELVTADQPAAFVARALALDALADPRGRGNLRRGPLAHPHRQASGRLAPWRAALAVGAAALLLGGGSVVLRGRLSAEDRRFEARFDGALAQVAGYVPRTRGEAALREAFDAWHDRRDPSLDPSGHAALPRMLWTLLDAAREQGVRIEHVSLETRGPTLSGAADSHQGARAFESALRSSGQDLRMEVEPARAGLDEVRWMITPGGAP